MSTQYTNEDIQRELACIQRHTDRRRARGDLKRKRNHNNADSDEVESLERSMEMEARGAKRARKKANLKARSKSKSLDHTKDMEGEFDTWDPQWPWATA